MGTLLWNEEVLAQVNSAVTQEALASRALENHFKPSIMFCFLGDFRGRENIHPESGTSPHGSKAKSAEEARGLIHTSELYLRAP